MAATVSDRVERAMKPAACRDPRRSNEHPRAVFGVLRRRRSLAVVEADEDSRVTRVASPAGCGETKNYPIVY